MSYRVSLQIVTQSISIALMVGLGWVGYSLVDSSV
jgi:hypothetical protein